MDSISRSNWIPSKLSVAYFEDKLVNACTASVQMSFKPNAIG